VVNKIVENFDTAVGYNPYRATIFTVAEKTITKDWEVIISDHNDCNRESNIKHLNEHYGLDVQSYEVKIIPVKYRRCVTDSAKLLVIKDRVKLYAKRHNNNKELNIRVE